VSEKTYTPQGELAKTCVAYVSQIGTILKIGGEFDEEKAADLLYKFMSDLIYRAKSASPAGTPEGARTEEVSCECCSAMLQELRTFTNCPDNEDVVEHIKKRLYAEARTAPQPTPNEEGWLIEKGQLCLGSCDRKPAWVTFTDPTAVRFARKIDAENMLNSLRSMSDAGAFEKCTIHDHSWWAAAASPSAEPAKPGETGQREEI